MNVTEITFTAADPADTDAQRCYYRYSEELANRFGVSMGPGWRAGAVSDDFRSPNGELYLVLLNGKVAGCGALRFMDGFAEVKRMWVDPAARGRGVGRGLLEHLESRAAAHGSLIVRLDTNETLREALALYQRAGYESIPCYNDNHHATHWFEKRLQ
jgi:ribosomal protein S18 acetylase RimI-like enzyme